MSGGYFADMTPFQATMRRRPIPDPTCTVVFGPRTARVLGAFSELASVSAHSIGNAAVVVATGAAMRYKYVAHWRPGDVHFCDFLRRPYDHVAQLEGSLSVEVHTTDLLRAGQSAILVAPPTDGAVGFMDPTRADIVDAATTVVVFSVDDAKRVVLGRPRIPRIVMSIGELERAQYSPRPSTGVRTALVLGIAECYVLLTGQPTPVCLYSARTVLIGTPDEAVMRSLSAAVAEIEYQDVLRDVPAPLELHVNHARLEMMQRAAEEGIAPHVLESTFSAFMDAVSALGDEAKETP